jgi:nucleotide-binding universal stress UspA family protein
MYDRVLVPTDGSPGSERAVAHAVDLAGRYGATLHALYVVDDEASPVAADTTTEERADDTYTTRERRAIDLVREPATEHDVPFVGDVRRGDPAPEILRYVDAAAIDLVVMATHGRTGLERRLLGSVTERVVRAAPVPVVTVGLRESTDAVATEGEARATAREAVAEEVGGGRRSISIRASTANGRRGCSRVQSTDSTSPSTSTDRPANRTS